jgi:hypothetical protein
VFGDWKSLLLLNLGMSILSKCGRCRILCPNPLPAANIPAKAIISWQITTLNWKSVFGMLRTTSGRIRNSNLPSTLSRFLWPGWRVMQNGEFAPQPNQGMATSASAPAIMRE